jgi:hypothetical protein
LWRHPPGPLPSIYRASRCRRPTAQDAARQHKIQCAAPYTISPALDARLRDAVSLLASYGPRLRYATWPRSRHRLRPGQPADHVRWSNAYGRVWWPKVKEAATAADCDAGRGTRAGGARAQGQENYRQAPIGAHHRGWRRLVTLVARPASPRRRHAVIALGRSRHCQQFAPRARTRPIPRAHVAQGQSSWPITPSRSCADPLTSARRTCLSSAT